MAYNAFTDSVSAFPQPLAYEDPIAKKEPTESEILMDLQNFLIDCPNYCAQISGANILNSFTCGI